MPSNKAIRTNAAILQAAVEEPFRPNRPGSPPQEMQLPFFVLEREGRVQAVFSLVPGPDPTYGEIDGAWLRDTPYWAIHRVASRWEAHGLTGEIFRWCMDRCGHLRIDTHADTKPMQRAIEKFGFVYCGIIKAHDGTPRVAFEKIEQAKIKQP